MDIIQQMGWLESWIKARLTLPTTYRFDEVLNHVSKGKSFQDNEMFKDIDISVEEKIVVLLSVSPLLIPVFMNSFVENGKGFNVLPGFRDKSDSSLLPTFETAVYLLAGSNINERKKYLSLFSSKSTLYRRSLIEEPDTMHGSSFTNSLLNPGTTVLNLLFMDNVEDPEFSHNFPATLLNSDYEWSDLILDSDTKTNLEEIKEWLEYADIIKNSKELLKKYKPGYKCLFYGPPGTGKTLAASLIGKLTNHKVYRIDLSAIVSKYIGETEKNLAKVFDRADNGKWILFFDEADALFGKRGQTQNAHDRYANQEVSYLLQRFETYSGVAILASNYKENIDKAFYRRFHNIINFKMPEADVRLLLWESHLPKGFSFCEDVDLSEVSNKIKLNGSGIYNVMRRSIMKTVLRKDKAINGLDMYESVRVEMAKENKTM